MKITFDLKAQISVPDADFTPEKGALEEMLSEIFYSEGMRAKNLSVENYSVSDAEAEGKECTM